MCIRDRNWSFLFGSHERPGTCSARGWLPRLGQEPYEGKYLQEPLQHVHRAPSFQRGARAGPAPPLAARRRRCECTRLASLHLQDKAIKAAGAQQLKAALTPLLRLEHLDLSGNNVRARGANTVAALLPTLHQLTCLEMDHNMTLRAVHYEPWLPRTERRWPG